MWSWDYDIIRYLDDTAIAKEIMSQSGLTLEEYLAGHTAPDVSIDLGGSDVYTAEELYDAVLTVKCSFAAWDGCELYAIRYAGDEAGSANNIEWLNSLGTNAQYVQAVEMLIDFQTDADVQDAWEPNHRYTDFQWWLARTSEGGWEIVSFGY